MRRLRFTLRGLIVFVGLAGVTLSLVADARRNRTLAAYHRAELMNSTMPPSWPSRPGSGGTSRC